MKNKGIIALVAIAVVVGIYFLFFNKSSDPNANKTVTTTTSGETGVAALFDTGAMSSLFGGLVGGAGKNKGSNSNNSNAASASGGTASTNSAAQNFTDIGTALAGI